MPSEGNNVSLSVLIAAVAHSCSESVFSEAPIPTFSLWCFDTLYMSMSNGLWVVRGRTSTFHLNGAYLLLSSATYQNRLPKQIARPDFSVGVYQKCVTRDWDADSSRTRAHILPNVDSDLIARDSDWDLKFSWGLDYNAKSENMRLGPWGGTCRYCKCIISVYCCKIPI